MKARSLILAGEPALECLATPIAASNFFQTLVLIMLLTDAVLCLKTANRAHTNPSHSMVLGFTADEFDPATLTLTTYCGINPRTLGNNAGVNPGTANPPFPNVHEKAILNKLAMKATFGAMSFPKRVTGDGYGGAVGSTPPLLKELEIHAVYEGSL